MKQIKSEFTKIAKLLKSAEVASEIGEYENFTGTINFKGVKAKVKNATFELKRSGAIRWNNGTWINGNWKLGTWEKGIWEDGDFLRGTWNNGTWKDGVFKGGWKNGTWEGGTFDGMWVKGKWKDEKNPRPNKR